MMTITRPSTNGPATDAGVIADRPGALRDRLRQAIASVAAETERLTALEQAQERAHQQMWEAESRLAGAKGAQERAAREERQSLAYRCANNDALTDDPVAAAKVATEAAQAEVDQLQRVEAALAGEIDKIQPALRTYRANMHAAIAEIVIASDEYAMLIEQHAAAWKQLRSIKTALRAVVAGLHGQMPQRYMDEPDRSEPLEPRVGYPVDNALISGWAEALAALEQDASAELPLFAPADDDR
jgi:chromosome segregation ATPase